MMVKLRQGATRPAVTLLQRGYNDRARQHGWPMLTVDGELGPATAAAVHRACHALGALGATLAIARRTRTISVGMQRMIRWPEKRSAAQLARAKQRAAAAKASRVGPQAAVDEAARHIGKSERTNLAWVMAIIKACIGVTFRVPWCGCFIHHCLRTAGVKVTGRCASVNNTLHDALAGANGFKTCLYRRATQTGNVAAGRAGDVLGLFGESTHMALVKRRVPGGYITREGNTSRNNQSDGRACEEKFRPDSAVVYIARPAYIGG